MQTFRHLNWGAEPRLTADDHKLLAELSNMQNIRHDDAG